MQWAATNSYKIIVTGGRDAWKLAGLLATNQVPVIFERIYNQASELSSTPARDTYRYDVPEHVRRRVFLTLQHCHKEQEFSTRRFDDFLAEIEEILTRRYGGLRAPMYEAAKAEESDLQNRLTDKGVAFKEGKMDHDALKAEMAALKANRR